MKPEIHPDYHPVVFQDATTGHMFLTRSTATSPRTIDWQTAEGLRTYPLIVVDVTADSHPVWTGKRQLVDTAGRVEKFNRKYGR
ncbi:large subunit ribosomal protein L31 [Mycobacterium sp. MAA66]|uniref:type B 50S ribosomal protein L31 n=1 Tax=Mycobacterium sp. MAA66 TaxID=3156297 RepID=UPI003516568D